MKYYIKFSSVESEIFDELESDEEKRKIPIKIYRHIFDGLYTEKIDSSFEEINGDEIEKNNFCYILYCICVNEEKKEIVKPLYILKDEDGNVLSELYQLYEKDKKIIFRNHEIDLKNYELKNIGLKKIFLR
ncbi:MAG: hypothetical protein NZZ41_00490 [Candidatus Dojkabacteria bacterium]|nr:hypothetical protein [Candidatus Dojkabacteria bacterium]